MIIRTEKKEDYIDVFNIIEDAFEMKNLAIIKSSF
jgi:predicted N-acetyltransferase YhbS